MLEFIQNIDESISIFFQSLHNHFLDNLFWYISEAWVFLPLWLWALWKIYFQYSSDKYLKLLLLIILTIVISDQVSNVSKNYFKRLRPTHNEVLKDKIKVVDNYRGGTYGFYSAHASNSAAICVLALLLIKNSRGKYWMILYPILTGMSRVYLGVHYFTDVLTGWIIGCLLAMLLFWGINKIFGLNKT